MKRKFIGILIFISYSFSAYSQVNLDSGLVACYNFSGNTNDHTGNGNHATNSGATLVTDRFGNPSSAYEFNGVNTSIDLNNDFDFPERTITLWFEAYSTAVGASKVIYDFDHPNLQNGHTKIRVIDNGGNKLRLSANDDNTAQDSDIFLNQWYMATITVDANFITFYLDETLVGQFAYANTPGSPNGHLTALIGTSRIFDRYFEGKIDDIKIYDRALNINEVSTLFFKTDCIPCSEFIDSVDLNDHLEACYDFSGNTNDLTGNGNDGTNNGATLTSDRFGNDSSAYEFDGLNNYIDLNNDFDYAERTVNVWFNSYSTSNVGSKIIYDSNHSGLQYSSTIIRVINDGMNKIRFSVGNPTTFYESILNLNQWYMATVTVDSNRIQYFIDGCKVDEKASVPNGHADDGNPTAILGATRIFDRHFHGKIDDLSIHSRALNPLEIQALYDSGLPCSSPTTSINDMEITSRHIRVYPNPSSTTVYITSTGDMPLEKMELYNSIGQLVFVQTDIRSKSAKFNVENYSPGLYVIKVVDRVKRESIFKLLIE